MSFFMNILVQAITLNQYSNYQELETSTTVSCYLISLHVL
jgi:hypothetical protein